MRAFFILAALVLSALPASALDWGRYTHSGIGLSIQTPPRFAGLGETPEGQVFANRARAQQLRVWGGAAPGGFEAAARAGQAGAEAEGWALTYQATTPQWAVFTAVRSGRVLEQRMIAACAGTRYLAFSLDFALAERADMASVIERLERTLTATGAC